MGTGRSISRAALAVLLATGLSACGGDDAPPTGPDGGDNGAAAVASIEVASPVDTLVALVRTARLTATARDADGAAVPGVELDWASSEEGVATVGPDGLVTPVGVGRTVITARAEGREGSLPIRVADADLDGIADLLDDPFTQALRSNGSDAFAAALESALAGCGEAIADGHLLALDDCLRSAVAGLESPADETDRVLAAVLELILDRTRRLMNL